MITFSLRSDGIELGEAENYRAVAFAAIASAIQRDLYESSMTNQKAGYCPRTTGISWLDGGYWIDKVPFSELVEYAMLRTSYLYEQWICEAAALYELVHNVQYEWVTGQHRSIAPAVWLDRPRPVASGGRFHLGEPASSGTTRIF